MGYLTNMFGGGSGGGQPGQRADVSTPSIERQAMDGDLELIGDIRAGAEAVRKNSTRYLPQYAMESKTEYQRRVQMAPWRAEFVDALRSLAAKPFNKDVEVGGDTPQALKDFAEDVDGQGNNLTRFAHHAFEEAIANGAHLILIDYPPVAPSDGRVLTVADEKEIGARPYWLHVSLPNIISLRTSVVRGREVVDHLRFCENQIVADGFGEREVERIRLIEPGTWEVWEKVESTWQLVDSGVLSLDEVPVALLFTGDRQGALRVKPPLRDLAEVQIELFRAMSRQDEILTYAGSPMLAATGIAKPGDGDPQVTVGPKSVLYAPPSDAGTASWSYISPDSGAIGEIRQQVDSIVTNMRRLGMQPMTQQSGTVTATATSVEAAKAHSVLGAWTVSLKDALEVAFTFTAAWMQEDHETQVEVFNDFAVGDQSAPEGLVLLAAQKQAVLSAQTTRDEFRRRGLLGPSYDESQEDLRIASEREGLEPEELIDPRGGTLISGNDAANLQALFSPAVLAGEQPDDLRDWFTPQALAAAGM